MSILSKTKQGAVPPQRLLGQSLRFPASIPTYILWNVLTVAGFVIALIVNILYPQVATLKLKNGAFLGFEDFSPHQLYQLVLIGLIVLYLGIGVFSYFKKERQIHFASRVKFRFAIGVALSIWDILGTKYMLLTQPFFPGPSKIFEAFLLEGEFIYTNTLYSLRLYAAGFIIGVIFGVATGVLIGWFPKVYYWVFPVLKFTGVIPAVAWMPFALTLSPTPFVAATFLIVICAWFPIAFLTAQGIASTPKVHFEVARTLGAKNAYLVFHVAIPHAMPHIFTGISSANGFAFTTLVMSEMLGQPGGLGYYINAAKVWSAYYKVFAAIIVMAILFSIIMKAIGAVQKRVLIWQRGLVK